MDALLTQQGIEHGFITRANVFDAGYTDRDIRDAKRSGILITIGPGLYAIKDSYIVLNPAQQHLIRCRAVAARLGDGVVVSHQSAAIAHRIPIWGVELNAVHVTRRDGIRGRREAGVIHHVGRICDNDIVDLDGMLVTRPSRAVWETVCNATIEAGMVTMDAALNLKIASREELIDASERFTNWKGSRRARITARLSDGRAESPGESRSRFLFWRFHVPKPELQFYVYTQGGILIARTDFAWPEARHLGEFDGKIKYDGTFGEDGRLTILDEKQREDGARAELFGMSRLGWVDLSPSKAAATAARFNSGIDQSKRLYTRNRTVIV